MTITDSILKRLRGQPRQAPKPRPLHGYTESRTEPRYVELLDDADLAELNGLLPWHSYTVDSRGRRFGDGIPSQGEDVTRPAIPDPRVVALDEHFDLSDKDVLEFGCFEGGHTIALCERAARVTAVDARVKNVVKTIVRCAFYGHHPTAFVCNLDTWEDDAALRADVLLHIGVLYHLVDPVRHLQRLPNIARTGLLLCTQVADAHEATDTMIVSGRTYRFARQPEEPHTTPKAGMSDHAKWLLEEDIVELLEGGGFAPVTVIGRERQRNGMRITLLAGPRTSRGADDSTQRERGQRPENQSTV